MAINGTVTAKVRGTEQQNGREPRTASEGRWVVEESFTEGMTWSPVRILRGEDEYEEVIVMEPEDWEDALWRFHHQAFIGLPEPDAYRLRNTHSGTLIFDGQVPPAP